MATAVRTAGQAGSSPGQGDVRAPGADDEGEWEGESDRDCEEETRLEKATEEEVEEPERTDPAPPGGETGGAVAPAVDHPIVLVEDGEALGRALADLAAYRGPLAVDTETTGLDPLEDTLLLVGLGRPNLTYLVDTRAVDARALGPLLADGRTFLFQNAKFDLQFLYQATGVMPPVGGDTLLAAQLLRAGALRLPMNLAALALRHLALRLPKEEQRRFVGHRGPFRREQLAYAARDVQVLFPLHLRLEADVEAAGLRLAYRLERAATPAVARMELTGCLIDRPRWERVIEETAARTKTLGADLADKLAPDAQRTLWGENGFNLNSNQQVLAALKERGIELRNTEMLTLKMTNHELTDGLMAYRDQFQVVKAFGESFLKRIHPRTGRIHADFRQMGTETGRFSCTNPNMQQIPAEGELRSCVVAPPGRALVIADYSQIELRILAHLSQDPRFLEAFRSGEDLHRSTAATMFGKELATVTDRERKAAKTINFGLVYGQGPGALGRTLKIPEEEAKSLVGSYFASYPGIARWLREAAREGMATGETRTPVIRRRRLLTMPGAGLRDYDPRANPEHRQQVGRAERQAKNTPIQSCSGDMMKIAMVGAHRRLPGSARIIMTVHDELVVEVDLEEAAATLATLEVEMRAAGEYLIPSVPVAVSGGISGHWEK